MLSGSDIEGVEREWKVVNEGSLRWPGVVRYVNAEANTGSRYAVVVSRLPNIGEMIEGGPLLVTVLSPWTAAWPLQEYGTLHLSYIAEHFVPAERKRPVAPVDLLALGMTITYATGRDLAR